MNAAAMPRPSNIPPAATTGIGDDLRDEIHRTDDAIAAGLAALRDNDVSATLRRFDRLRNRRDLDHYFRADVVGLPHQIAGIPERERYDGGSCGGMHLAGSSPQWESAPAVSAPVLVRNQPTMNEFILGVAGPT